MNALFGAIKGVSRGLLLLILVALLPGLAWTAAHFGSGLLGLGFWHVFFVALALEVLLSIAALMGIASEVQRPDFDAVRRSTRERESHS